MVIITQTFFSCWSRVFSDHILEIGIGIALFFFVFFIGSIRDCMFRVNVS